MFNREMMHRLKGMILQGMGFHNLDVFCCPSCDPHAFQADHTVFAVHSNGPGTVSAGCSRRHRNGSCRVPHVLCPEKRCVCVCVCFFWSVQSDGRGSRMYFASVFKLERRCIAIICKACWWFQPNWKNVRQVGSFPQVGVKIKKHPKPPPSTVYIYIYNVY